MYITLTDRFDSKVNKTIEIAKEHGVKVIFERDGVHGTADLEVICKFQEAGFAFRIERYKGTYDEKAIRVVFFPKVEK